MTRTDWNNIIDGALAPFGLSSSAVAEWRLWRDVVVDIVLNFVGIIAIFKADITNYVSTKQTGLPGWYVDVCKYFQNGDSLVSYDGILKYPVIDATKQVVKLAAVTEIDEDILVIKVATISSGVIGPLSGPQLTNFKNYMNARRPPGVKLNIVSNSPDVVYYEITAEFDPMFSEADVSAGINAALDTFRLNFPFDGIFYKSAFLASVENVPGVVGVQLDIDLIFSTGEYVSGLIYKHEMPAGYFNYDSGSFISLSSI